MIVLQVINQLLCQLKIIQINSLIIQISPMKKILSILAILFLSHFCSAQQKLSFSDYVGIGTYNPLYKLTLQGAEETGSPDRRTFLYLNNTTQSTASLVSMQLKTGTSNTTTYLTQASSIYGTDYYGNEYADFGQLWSTGAGLILRAGSSSLSGVIKFQTGSTSIGGSNERMRIAGNGNVGIGTNDPKTKLQITSGDIYVDDPTKGIILKSPNGSCWRVTIDNAGNFVKTSITCPQ